MTPGGYSLGVTRRPPEELAVASVLDFVVWFSVGAEMAFMAELLVDEYGYVFGGEDAFPVDVTVHDWESPYPKRLKLRWEAGEWGTQPNIFRHPEILDWVCDDIAWSVLSKVAPSDVRRLGRGYLGEKELHVIQVVTMLNIVDIDTSIVADHGSYRVIEFPTFRDDTRVKSAREFFEFPVRIPIYS